MIWRNFNGNEKQEYTERYNGIADWSILHGHPNFMEGREIMTHTGRRHGNSRLKSYTYVERKCRICDRTVSQLNLHFMRAHHEIYYNEYPGRRRMMMREETA